MKPEAKTYYELAAATLRFKFPEPGGCWLLGAT